MIDRCLAPMPQSDGQPCWRSLGHGGTHRTRAGMDRTAENRRAERAGKAKPKPATRRVDPELGVVRLCRRCEEWWPLDTEFWYWCTPSAPRTPYWSHYCRACWSEHNASRPDRSHRAKVAA